MIQARVLSRAAPISLSHTHACLFSSSWPHIFFSLLLLLILSLLHSLSWRNHELCTWQALPNSCLLDRPLPPLLPLSPALETQVIRVAGLLPRYPSFCPTRTVVRSASGSFLGRHCIHGLSKYVMPVSLLPDLEVAASGRNTRVISLCLVHPGQEKWQPPVVATAWGPGHKHLCLPLDSICSQIFL